MAIFLVQDFRETVLAVSIWHARSSMNVPKTPKDDQQPLNKEPAPNRSGGILLEN